MVEKKYNYLEDEFGEVLDKILRLKSRKKQLQSIELIYQEAEYDNDDGYVLEDYKEELKEKINKEKTYILKHHKEITNYQRCLLELDLILKLLEE